MRRTQITKIHELAIRSGAISIAHSWREKLSVPDARDKCGNSLLMLAAKYGQKNLVEYFIEAGVPQDARNDAGLSAADLALQNGFYDVYEELFEAQNHAHLAAETLNTDFDKTLLKTEDNIDLNGWESEDASHPPEHDEALAAKALAAFHHRRGHRPIDDTKAWEETKIKLPSQNHKSDEVETEFPLLEELIAFCMANHLPVCEQSFLSALDESECTVKVLPDFFWEELPERLGFDLEPPHLGGRTPSKADKEIYCSPDQETLLLVNEAVKQWKHISDLWSERYVSQFQLRDVLDRKKEERLGQRMDSAILAIRKIAQKTEYREALESLKYRCPAGEVNEEADGLDEETVGDESTSEKEPEDFDKKSFMAFITGESDFEEGDFPPRPTHEEMSFLKVIIKEKNQIFLSEIDFQYQRYLNARDQFLLSNLRLVLSIAKNYKRTHNLSLEDHVQNGLIGLMKAVEKYNYRLGFKFSTYGSTWIQQHITREIANHSNTLRLPVHAYMSKRKLEQAIKKQSSLKVDEEKLQSRTGFTSGEIEKIKSTFHESISIDILSEIMPQDLNYSETSSIQEPFNAIDAAEMKSLVNRVVGLLNPKQAKIVQMRFGLDGHEEHTLEQIGQMFGLTRERIRQIESKALAKLRAPSMAHHLISESCKGVIKHGEN